MGIVRRVPFAKPLIGTILHDMLHAWIKAQIVDSYDGDPWKVLEKFKAKFMELFREQREEYGDIPGMCEKIFEGYLRRWKDDGVEYLGTEEAFETPLTDDITLQGYLDARIVQKSTGLKFLLERKFHGRLPDAQDRFSDIQTLLYFWAWNREHPKDQLDGVVWDYGRMKAPAVPDLLKNGELTRRANIDTDQYTYLQAIKDNGLKPRDYTEILESLRGKETTFFERVWLPAPPKAMIESIVADARVTAITRLKMGDIAPRDGMSMLNCKRCEYRSICEAEIRGHDTKFVLASEYKTREKEDVDGDEEE
jgi:hypothetical protein